MYLLNRILKQKKMDKSTLIGHFRITLNVFLKQVLMPILSYDLAPVWAASCHLFSETKSTVGGFQKSVVFQNWTPQKNFQVKIIPLFPTLVWKTYPPSPSWGGHNSLRPSLDRFFYLFLFNISFIFSLVYCLYYFSLFKTLKFSCLCLWMKLLSFFSCN